MLLLQEVWSHTLSSKVNISPGWSTSGKWIIDSGATCHICNNQSSFVELYPLKTHTDVKVGDGQILSATAKGVVFLRVRYGRESQKCKLNNVLYVPDLSCNILSVSKAAEKGTTMKFSESSFVI